MRLTALLFAPLAIFAFSASSALSDDAQATLPERKAGLWELKTVMDEGNGPRDVTMKLCVDSNMEKSTVSASILEHKANCTSYDIKPAAGGTEVNADCLYNGRKVISTTNMSGDFKTAFEIKIQSTTSEPKTTAQSVVVKRTITQLGKYVAESCGELKGGEAEASGRNAHAGSVTSQG